MYLDIVVSSLQRFFGTADVRIQRYPLQHDSAIACELLLVFLRSCEPATSRDTDRLQRTASHSLDDRVSKK